MVENRHPLPDLSALFSGFKWQRLGRLPWYDIETPSPTLLGYLGIHAVWITACFDSPNADNCYGVRDYRRIHPGFGSMNDFDRFMAEAQRQKIRVILDMLFNHSSDEHEWFKQSRLSRDNPCRDFYFWRDPVNGGPPNNACAYGGPAGESDKTTGQYCLHLYAIKRADLN